MTNHILSILWHWINDASNLIVPQRCPICGRRLRSGESILCLHCFANLPLTHLRGKIGNKVERLFWGRIPVVRANSWMCYMPQSESSQLLIQLKYGNRPDIGKYFGRVIANDLIDTDFFSGIDYLIPIPLAKERQKKRGYNQSERLAEGVHEITHIPMCTKAIIRSRSNPSQTKFSAEERQENVKNIFTTISPTTIKGKHLLIIDDILTTGATIISCAQELAKTEGVSISILTLGLAGTHHTINRKEEEF